MYAASQEYRRNGHPLVQNILFDDVWCKPKKKPPVTIWLFNIAMENIAMENHNF